MEFKEGMVIHCPKEWMAIKLFKELNNQKFMWKDLDSLLIDNCWRNFEEMTCYQILKKKKIGFAKISFYKDNNFKIIEFEDIFKKKDTINKYMKIAIKAVKDGKCRSLHLDYLSNNNYAISIFANDTNKFYPIYFDKDKKIMTHGSQEDFKKDFSEYFKKELNK